jgi:DNA-binding NtrC family response regulator
LIVEDHEVTRDALTHLFEKEGFRVEGAGSVGEALKQFKEKSPTIAVVDIGLPDGSGLQLVQAFSAKEGQIPVIVVTASDELGLAKEAMKRGAFSFIHKPYGFAEILAVVRNALKQS